MFVPFRISRVDPTKRFDLIVYFNDKGEVFDPRHVPEAATTAVLPVTKPGFRVMARLLAEAAPDDPQKMESIGARYLALPENDIPGSVQDHRNHRARSRATLSGAHTGHLATHFPTRRRRQAAGRRP